jgi:ABC-type enterobactin transport system permease subunit
MLRSRSALVLGLVGGSGLLVVCLVASVRFGAASVGTRDVVMAFVDYGGSEKDLITRTLRVPRALIAALVGEALAVAIIQGLTRNPLSDPGILGIEDGAGGGQDHPHGPPRPQQRRPLLAPDLGPFRRAHLRCGAARQGRPLTS